MNRSLLAGLDDWRARQPKKISRPDAVRQMVSDRLHQEGLLPRFRGAQLEHE